MIKRLKKHLWLWIALIVVLLLTGKYSVNSFRKYQVWSEHKAYFEQPIEERKIQTWMTPNFINRYYNIDLHSALGFTPGFKEQRNSLDEMCEKHQLDCSTLVDKLDKAVPKKAPTTK